VTPGRLARQRRTRAWLVRKVQPPTSRTITRPAGSLTSPGHSFEDLPLAGQLLEGVSVEQCLVELPALLVVHLHERRVADHLLDAAAQNGARHSQKLRGEK
jgi:hypothetical protein